MKHNETDVRVVGAGLAGCESAWQLANHGLHVELLEMKTEVKTPAQQSESFAELVCSNSLRSQNIENAVGLLKQEMWELDSLIIAAAAQAAVPAGDALAVNREQFSGIIHQRLESHPNITIVHQVVDSLPREDQIPTIVATGPLTHHSLAQDIVNLMGEERLYFYDAIAPIIEGESIDRTKVFEASRYGKGNSSDYLNCGLNREQYQEFLAALLAGECMPLHSFEKPKYFQGCMPIEVIAESGPDSLRFGTMKPVGLRHPQTGETYYAVVQLRKEDKAGQAYNMVGFQTKLKYPEQKRIFRMIPGLETAVFLRLGAIHRNTYLDSPKVLDANMALQGYPHVLFAGQITGVEGYVESAAHGLLTARRLAASQHGGELSVPPASTALGALYRHVRGDHRHGDHQHEPQNINWGMFPPLQGRVPKKEKKSRRAEQARKDFHNWLAETQAGSPKSSYVTLAASHAASTASGTSNAHANANAKANTHAAEIEPTTKQSTSLPG